MDQIDSDQISSTIQGSRTPTRRKGDGRKFIATSRGKDLNRLKHYNLRNAPRQPSGQPRSTADESHGCKTTTNESNDGESYIPSVRGKDITALRKQKSKHHVFASPALIVRTSQELQRVTPSPCFPITVEQQLRGRTFAEVTYIMITDIESTDPELMGWSSDGGSFYIRTEDKTKLIARMKPYFSHGNFASFRRQLSSYRFQRRNKFSSKMSIWFHPEFRRDMPKSAFAIIQNNRTQRDKPRKQKVTSAGVYTKNKQVKSSSSKARRAKRKDASVKSDKFIKTASSVKFLKESVRSLNSVAHLPLVGNKVEMDEPVDSFDDHLESVNLFAHDSCSANKNEMEKVVASLKGHPAAFGDIQTIKVLEKEPFEGIQKFSPALKYPTPMKPRSKPLSKQANLVIAKNPCDFVRVDFFQNNWINFSPLNHRMAEKINPLSACETAFPAFDPDHLDSPSESLITSFSPLSFSPPHNHVAQGRSVKPFEIIFDNSDDSSDEIVVKPNI